MKYLLIITMFFAWNISEAQENPEQTEQAEPFTKSYTHFQFSEKNADGWKEIKEGQTLFVFNKGTDKHIQWIFNGEKYKLYKTSKIVRDTSDNGAYYQAFEAITQQGNELYVALFDSGTLILHYIKDNESIRFINPDYLKE